jgi:glutamate synthase domain-containing protein 2
VKIGQGAKQGLGGEIRFESDADSERYRQMGYFVAKAKNGGYERHATPGSLAEDELRAMLVKKAELGLPIWVKTGIGRGILNLIAFLDRVKREQGLKIECLTVDGFGGGTGMSPWLIMNETSVPSGAVFASLGRKPAFDILLAGGMATGIDAAKAMMLGASGIASGRPFVIAATVDKKDGVPNYVSALREELQMACATQRVDSAEKLRGRRQNLFALDSAAAAVFGISDQAKAVL